MRGYTRSGSGLWVPKRLQGCELVGLQQGIVLAQQPTAAAGSGSATTWSPTDLSGPNGWALSNGNLTITTGSQSLHSIRATSGVGSGRFDYWEVQFGTEGAGRTSYIGVCLGSQSISAISSPYWLLNNSGTVFSAGGSGSGGGGDVAAGDYLMFAYEYATKRLYFGVTGTWRNSGDPNAGTGYVWTFTSSNTFYPLAQADNSGPNSVHTLNCGAVAFSGTKPTACTALGAP